MSNHMLVCTHSHYSMQLSKAGNTYKEEANGNEQKMYLLLPSPEISFVFSLDKTNSRPPV